MNGDELAARDVEALAVLVDNPNAGVTLHTDGGARAAAALAAASKKSTLRRGATKAGLMALATASLAYAAAYNKKRPRRSATGLPEKELTGRQGLMDVLTPTASDLGKEVAGLGGLDATRETRVKAAATPHLPQRLIKVAYSSAMDYVNRSPALVGLFSAGTSAGVFMGGVGLDRGIAKFRKNRLLQEEKLRSRQDVPLHDMSLWKDFHGRLAEAD